MNNVIMRVITLDGGDYKPLVPESLIAGTVVISCPPANAGPVFFKGDDGSDVPWTPSEWHEFKSVDLHEVQVKGSDGDTVTIVGGTF
jgi:hypothetical protein